jgi:hypothetical protein
MTAMRAALVVAVSFLIACGGGEKTIGGGDTISHLSQTLSAKPRFDRGPTRYFLKLEFTMPRQFPVGALGGITMTDTSGRRFESMENSLTLTSNDGIERIGTKFEVAEDSQPGVVHIGDYLVDIPSGRVTCGLGPAAP